MILTIFFSILFLIFLINLVHALKTRFFSAMPIFLKTRFNDPSASPRIAYLYGVVTGSVAIAIFPMYWMLVCEYKYYFNNDWKAFAKEEVENYYFFNKK